MRILRCTVGMACIYLARPRNLVKLTNTSTLNNRWVTIVKKSLKVLHGEYEERTLAFRMIPHSDDSH